jgi:anti-anti-sigma factor
VRIVERRQSDTVLLTLTGDLDRSSAQKVHRRILVSLAEHQVGLVCDVARVEVIDPVALTLFHGISTQARYWPGVPVVLCRAGSHTADHLRRLGIDRVLPVQASMTTAVTGARARLPTSGDVLRLPPRPESAAVARHFVRRSCRDYPAETVENAVLLVNELVSNALRHGTATDLTVCLSLQGSQIRLGVSDGDPRLPHTLPRAADGAWAWELRLLNAFADRWGALPTANGKLVWCLLQA